MTEQKRPVLTLKRRTDV
ncbi:hypothetical protein, partial [Escherichia coli]|nr:hypothetical protein [Escherichia coli]EKF2770803.1 hypothetical protein [Escherichia coli]